MTGYSRGSDEEPDDRLEDPDRDVRVERVGAFAASPSELDLAGDRDVEPDDDRLEDPVRDGARVPLLRRLGGASESRSPRAGALRRLPRSGGAARR